MLARIRPLSPLLRVRPLRAAYAASKGMAWPGGSAALRRGSVDEAVLEAEALHTDAAVALVEGVLPRLVERVTKAVAADAARDKLHDLMLSADYVVRVNELSQLAPALRPTEPARRIVIAGAAGSGRTMLARWALLLHMQHFRRIWVVDAATPESFFTGIGRVATALGLAGDDPAGGRSEAVKVQDALDSTEHAGWGLLLQNLDDVRMADVVWGWLPVSGGCIVVTTTQADWSRTLRGAHGGPVHRVFLEPATDADAGTLMGAAIHARLAAKPEQDSVVERVNTALGGQLLAVAQATAYIKHSRTAWSAYLAALPPPPPSGATGAAPEAAARAATVGLAVRAALQESPVCATLLQLVQLLDRTSIPSWLLGDLCRQITPSVTAHECDRALKVLDALHLLRLNPPQRSSSDANANVTDDVKVTVSVHAATQAALCQFVPCRPSTVAHVCIFLDAVTRAHSRAHVAHMRATLLHLTHLKAWLERSLPGSLMHADVLRVSADIIGRYFGDAASACTLYERALAIERAVHAPAASHFRLVVVASNLASVYADTPGPGPDPVKLRAYVDTALGYARTLLDDSPGGHAQATGYARTLLHDLDGHSDGHAQATGAGAAAGGGASGYIDLGSPERRRESLLQTVAYLESLIR